MTPIVRLCAATAALFLASCAYTQSAADYRSKIFLVTITVGGNGCGGGIAVSPDPIIVQGKGGTVNIQWTVTGDWGFDGDGIHIRGGEGFSAPKIEGKVANLDYTPPGRAGIVTKYDVNLRRGTGERCQLDPVIMTN